MNRDKPREQVAGMARVPRMTPIFRSVPVTLFACATAIGLVAIIGLSALSGCASDPGEDDNITGEPGMEQSGTENPASEPDDGEESGDLLALDETYDFVRKGARLILQYDAAGNSFVGTVQNTTESVLRNVRVEVHLSNGTELGPTTPVDLTPGETVEVSLAATEEPFTGWTPHAEVGEGEHGGGGEDGEHGGGGESGEGGGEHGSGGEGGGEHGGSGERGGEHGSGG